MIFPQFERVDFNSSGYSEPIYSYLNRSARPSTIKVRELIESWFSHYPVESQGELLPRLKSHDDRELCSAFFEIYLHEISQRIGYGIEIHPTTSENTLKKPDFLVKADDEEFFLEAVMTHELSDDEQRGQKLLNLAFDKINEIQSTDFFAHLEIEGYASSSIRSRELKRDIEDWFNSLDYDTLSQEYQARNDMPFKLFEFEGVTLKVSPIPKNLHKGRNERIIGSQMYGVRLVNTKEAIRKAIKGKASHYGELNKPFILAINVQSMSCDPDDVLDALFGSEQFIININAPSKQPPKYNRARDGAWARKKCTRVSGILLIKNLTPWTVAYEFAILYLNPWAKFPYRGKLMQLPYAEVRSNGQMQWIDGKHPREIFGLKENWPEDIT